MFSVLIERIDHLGNVDTDSDTYFRIRLQRLITEYLLWEGHFDTGIKLIKELKLENFTDLEVYVESNEIL